MKLYRLIIEAATGYSGNKRNSLHRSGDEKENKRISLYLFVYKYNNLPEITNRINVTIVLVTIVSSKEIAFLFGLK